MEDIDAGVFQKFAEKVGTAPIAYKGEYITKAQRDLHTKFFVQSEIDDVYGALRDYLRNLILIQRNLKEAYVPASGEAKALNAKHKVIIKNPKYTAKFKNFFSDLDHEDNQAAQHLDRKVYAAATKLQREVASQIVAGGIGQSENSKFCTRRQYFDEVGEYTKESEYDKLFSESVEKPVSPGSSPLDRKLNELGYFTSNGPKGDVQLSPKERKEQDKWEKDMRKYRSDMVQYEKNLDMVKRKRDSSSRQKKVAQSLPATLEKMERPAVEFITGFLNVDFESTFADLTLNTKTLHGIIDLTKPNHVGLGKKRTAAKPDKYKDFKFKNRFVLPNEEK